MNKIQRYERKNIVAQGDAIPRIPVAVSQENAEAIAQLTQQDVNQYISSLSTGSVENQIIAAVGLIQRLVTELTYMGVDLNSAYFAVLGNQDINIELLGGVQEESPSVVHAERELKLIGEDEDTIDGVANAISAWHEMGHSGGSHFALMPVLQRLLAHENLTPLTNDPAEWFKHDASMNVVDDKPFWQNIRNGSAFSDDGGQTYYLVSEGANQSNKFPLHKSVNVSTTTDLPLGEVGDVIPE